MSSFNLKPLMAGLLAAGLVGTAFAEEGQGPNVSATKAAPSASAQAVENVLLARQLAAYAGVHQDALGLVVAARMLQDNPTQDGQRQKEGGNNEVVVDPVSVESLLTQAREQSGGRTEVIAMIDETASRGASKGRSAGPLRHADRVIAGTTDVYRTSFDGGESARLGVVGDGNADIDCYVYDSNDNLVASDGDSTSTCALGWTPARTGTFIIKVKNIGSSSSTYLMVSN
jgi:hypothetical protein